MATPKRSSQYSYTPETGYAEAERRIETARKGNSPDLVLSALGLIQVPESIGQLKELMVLDLSDNRLTEVPASLGQLAALNELDLSDNRLTEVPASLGQLTALKELDLSDNRLTEVPASLGQLAALKELRLSYNRLTEVPASLGQLAALKELHLSYNRLTEVPASLGQLTALKELHLSYNRLTEVPASLGQLLSLKTLGLEDNRLASLPESFRQMKQLEGLFLEGNTDLEPPKDILGANWRDVINRRGKPARPSDILDYYFKARKNAVPLNEVKMLLVGRGEAGKSSIRDSLLGFGFDPKKKETPGIQIDLWQEKQGKETLRLHVWDFAGQELTHGTHQFFLTERSVYVLVLDARADTQDKDVLYWLRLIQAFGGDSPVIVALNKWDTKPFDVDRHAIQENFTRIKAFISTDCETGLGISELKAAILNAVAGIESVHEPFPAEWARTKNQFSAMESNYLTFDLFREKCAMNGVKEKQDQETLARILHRLGIVLHYADDARLRDTTVLKPHWVTECIYKLLRLKEGPKSDGTLTYKEACKALPNEQPDMVRYLIGLMRRFELCFPVDEDEENWLVPELLPRFQPALGKEWQAAGALRLKYEYTVLPEGLLPRFITRTYPLSEGLARWRRGAVLSSDGARALVRVEGNHITVTVSGDAEGRQRLAKLIRNHFAHIHRDLKGLNPTESIEVEGQPGKYVSVALLEQDERNKSVTTVPTEKGSIEVRQTHELDRISTAASRDPEQKRLRLFLSYSHKDSGMRDKFSENLAVMEQDGLMDWWFDGKIVPSAEWDKEIRRELEEADLVVFLVSTPFLGSKYIQGVEMKRALERRKKDEAELVSVILEDCNWRDRPFTQYQLVLPGGHSVRKCARHRDAFNVVETELRRLIEKMLAKNAKAGRLPD